MSDWALWVMSTLAALGLGCNLWLWWVTIMDVERLRRKRRNGIRMHTAISSRRSEVDRVVTQLCLLAVWGQALVWPRPDNGEPMEAGTLIVLIVLIGVSLIQVRGALLDLRDRRELIWLADALEGHHKTEEEVEGEGEQK